MYTCNTRLELFDSFLHSRVINTNVMCAGKTSTCSGYLVPFLHSFIQLFSQCTNKVAENSFVVSIGINTSILIKVETQLQLLE